MQDIKFCLKFCLKFCFCLLKIARWEKHRRNRITRHYSAELQTTKQTYGNFPCHLRVDRDELALINCRWKCKKGKCWPLSLVHSRKLTKTTISPAQFPAVTVTVVRNKKIRTALRTSQIAALGLRSWTAFSRPWSQFFTYTDLPAGK